MITWLKSHLDLPEANDLNTYTAVNRHLSLWIAIWNIRYLTSKPTWDPFYWDRLTLMPALLTYCIQFKMWGDNNLPFTNFNTVVVEFCEWLSNFIPYFAICQLLFSLKQCGKQDLLRCAYLSWFHGNDYYSHAAFIIVSVIIIVVGASIMIMFTTVVFSNTFI